jgi:PAS domain S-box-containing protein
MARIGELTGQLYAVNARLTPLEVQFSRTLGDASRLLVVALKAGVTVCGVALLLMGAFVTRQLVRSMEAAASDLRSSEARKAAMLEASLDAVISIDGHGRVLEFNRAAEQMFGYTRAEVMGEDMITLIAPAGSHDAHRAGLAAHLKTGRSTILGRRLETIGRRGDGTTFPIELAIARTAHDGPPMFTGFLRDLTERRRTEQELAEARKLETVGRLAGGVAHDFNNILTAIIGFAELVREDLQAAGLATADIEEVRRAASRAQALTAQLLA